MARKRKRRSRAPARSSRRRRRPLRRLLPSLTRIPVRPALLGCLVVAVATLSVWGALRVKAVVEEDDRFLLENWRLELGEFPRWVTPEIEEKILAVDLTVGGRSINLFEKGALARVREAFAASPWVSAVPDVRLSYPTTAESGIIEVKLRLRAPVAIVKIPVGTRDFYYVTDASGMQLAEAYDESPRDWFRIPVITGVREAIEIPGLGGYWKSRDVLEAIEVAKILVRGGIHREFPAHPVEAIDVSNVAGRLRHSESEIVLYCAGRSLEWGRSPISRSSRTLPVPEILNNLRAVLRRIDEPRYRSVKLFKLYYPEVIYQKG